jgi:hypothetical protein
LIKTAVSCQKKKEQGGAGPSSETVPNENRHQLDSSDEESAYESTLNDRFDDLKKDFDKMSRKVEYYKELQKNEGKSWEQFKNLLKREDYDAFKNILSKDWMKDEFNNYMQKEPERKNLRHMHQNYLVFN